MNEVRQIPQNGDFPNAGAGDHERNFDVLNQTEQEAWDHYLEGGNRNDERKYRGPERRTQTSKIDREIYVIAGMKRDSSGGKERDILIHEYQDWAPTSLKEARDGIIGMQKRVEIAANINAQEVEDEDIEHKRDRAVVKRVRSYQGYLIDAAHDLDTLQQVMEHPTDEDSRFDPSLFRGSAEAQQIVVKQFLFRSLLWDKYENRWPASNTDKYKEREKYWNGFITEAVKGASNEALVHMLDIFYARAEARFSFLKREYSKVEKMPVVKSLIEKNEIVPMTVSKLLSEKYEREWKEEGAEGLFDDGELVKQTDFGAMIPDKVRSAIEAQRQREDAETEALDADYDREYERRDSMGIYTDEQIRRDIAKMKIGRSALSTELFDESDKKEIDETSARARAVKPPQAKKHPRRFTKPRFGWGAHSADGDKRVETSHELNDRLF